MMPCRRRRPAVPLQRPDRPYVRPRGRRLRQRVHEQAGVAESEVDALAAEV
jgi:hypothetical protein